MCVGVLLSLCDSGGTIVNEQHNIPPKRERRVCFTGSGFFLRSVPKHRDYAFIKRRNENNMQFVDSEKLNRCFLCVCEELPWPF